MNRIAAGHALVVSPYGGPAYSVSLKPADVEGFVFWTRNIGLLTARLPDIGKIAPFMVQFTVTGYPRPLEPGAIDCAAAVDQIRQLASTFGARSVVWRYDPIIITSLTSPAWHQENFGRLASAVAGAVDEVTLSFTHIYAKTRRNLEAAARHQGFDWRDPPDDEKRSMITDLAGIAAEHDMRLTLCTQPDYLTDGASPARCIDAGRLSDIAGRPITARTKGNRPGCLCAESRDIGAYDTCAQGCVYCYAVSNREAAKQFLAAHDPASESLAPARG